MAEPMETTERYCDDCEQFEQWCLECLDWHEAPMCEVEAPASKTVLIVSAVAWVVIAAVAVVVAWKWLR